MNTELVAKLRELYTAWTEKNKLLNSPTTEEVFYSQFYPSKPVLPEIPPEPTPREHNDNYPKKCNKPYPIRNINTSLSITDIKRNHFIVLAIAIVVFIIGTALSYSGKGIGIFFIIISVPFIPITIVHMIKTENAKQKYDYELYLYNNYLKKKKEIDDYNAEIDKYNATVYKENMEEYQSQVNELMAAYNQEIVEYEKKCEEVRNEHKDEYIAVCQSEQERVYELDEIIQANSDLLHPKYYISLPRLIEYIELGRADSIKDAINLMYIENEAEQRRKDEERRHEEKLELEERLALAKLEVEKDVALREEQLRRDEIAAEDRRHNELLEEQRRANREALEAQREANREALNSQRENSKNIAAMTLCAQCKHANTCSYVGSGNKYCFTART